MRALRDRLQDILEAIGQIEVEQAKGQPGRVKAMAAARKQWARRVRVIYEPPAKPDCANRTRPPDNVSPMIAKRPLTITCDVVAE